MSEINIEIDGGTSKRLLTAGKYCDRDIVITATGSGGASSTNIDESEKPTTETLLVSSAKLGHVSFPNATSIGDQAFYDCCLLTEVSFPKATTIDFKAFHSCVSLTHIDIPMVTSIGENAFQNCASLTSINFPAATSIGQGAFFRCPQLTDVVLPVATTIGNSAFILCESLTHIDFPSATSIGGMTFEGCVNLTSVILRTTSTVCVVSLNTFIDTPLMTGQGHIYVPAEMYEYYRAGYEPVINELMPGFFDIMFRKIEDYPEICGTN